VKLKHTRTQERENTYNFLIDILWLT